MSTLRTRVVASISAVQSSALGTSTGTATSRIEQTTAVDMANGTGTGEATASYRSEFTVTVGTPYSIDLQALFDQFGAALAFTKIKGFKVEIGAVSTTGNTLAITGNFNPLSAASSSAMAGLALYDAAVVYRGAGVTVDGSHNTLTFTATGTGTVTATLTLVGN